MIADQLAEGGALEHPLLRVKADAGFHPMDPVADFWRVVIRSGVAHRGLRSVHGVTPAVQHTGQIVRRVLCSAAQ